MKSEEQVVVILSAMQQELDAVVNHMTEVDSIQLGGISVLEGQLFGKSCVAALSGVGKVASAVTIQTIMLTYNVAYVVFTGVGGALNDAYEIGDIVVARDCLQHDMDGRGLGFREGRYLTPIIIFLKQTSNWRVWRSMLQHIILSGKDAY